MVDSRLAFDIMARDDGASAVLDKVARAADRTGASLKKNSKISDEAAKASANLTKARNSETTALDKVQIAEQRLAEVRGNSNSKTSQILAAEKALSKARRDAAVAGNVAQKAAKDLGAALDNEGKKAGKGFGKSVLHWFTGAGKDLEKAGKAGGESVNAGFLGVLKTPVVGPAVVAGVLAAAATVLPAAGAVAAGAVVAGFGAGLAGLGIVFAAKSVVVKNAWNRVLASMAADMKVLSRPFEQTLVSMAAIAKRTFATFKPALSDAFKGLAPELTAFGDQLGRAFEKLAPAIRPMADAFANVLRSLGPAMQDAVGKVSQGLQVLANSVSANPGALADLVRGVGDLTKTLLDGIATLNNINGAFERLTGGVSLVDVAMRALKFPVVTLLGPFVALEKAMEAVGLKAADTGHAVDITAESTKLWTQGLTAAQAAAVGTGAALDPIRTKAQALAATFTRQWAATQKANDALTRMSGLLLTLSGSEIAYQQAVDDATASIKENGKTHDINTAKGRANKTALDQVAASANAQTIAMRNAGDGNVAAAKHGESARASFIKLATQMGYSVPVAKAMATSMIAIPNVTRTAKLNANKKDLETKVAQAKTELANPNLTKERRAKLTADIENAKSGIATINGMLANLPKSKTITLNTFKNMIETVTHQDIGVRPPGRAVGGPVTKGMPYVVGEHRPELFVPNQSGTIIPKVPSQAIGQSVAQGMAGGIRGGAGSAISAASDIANAVLAKARSVLGISSPSKAFAQLGLWVNQGFSIGLRGSAKQVQSVMASLMSKVLNISFNAADTKASIQKTITSLNASIAAARKRIKPIDHGMTKSEVAAANRNNASVAASIKALQAKLRSAKTDLANVASIASRLGTTPKRNAIIALLNVENKAMQALANKRVVVANQLKAAQAKLAGAVQIRDEFRKSITDAALAFNSITNITPQDGYALGARDIVERMQFTLTKTREFAANLASLKKLGIRSDLYKQIAEAGIDAGGATAAALLQGGKGAIGQVNSLQAQIATASAGLGSVAATNLYQAGVDAAQGLVNGLLAKTKALDAASKKLAASIVAQIKKTLGIHSPSRVLMDLGSMTGQGFAVGIEGEYGRVTKAGVGLGDAATGARGQFTPRARSKTSAGSASAAPIVLEFRTDGSPHMNWLVDEFRKYIRINGGDVQAVLGR